MRADQLKGQENYRELMSISLTFAKMKSDNFIELSTIHFDKLLKQFEDIHALIRCPVDGIGTSISKTQFIIKEFIVLLRYCLMMLPFLEFDLSLLWEKCGVIFKILGKVSLPRMESNFQKFSSISDRNSFSQDCDCSSGEISKESDQLIDFFSLILEVFIAEFTENVALKKHLILFCSLTPNTERLYSCRNTHTDSCIVLELVSNHFHLFVKSGLAFSRFLCLLSGSSELVKITPEISMDVSLKLISTPFILSAPYIIQAHLILLASRCISTHLTIDGQMSDTPGMSCHTNPFQLSVNLYLSYLSTLQLDDNVRSNHGIISPLSHCTVRRMTWDKLTHQANDLGDFSHLHSEGILCGTKSEVLAHSAAYIHGNHPRVNQLCKEATCFVVDYIMENIFPRELWEQGKNENKERLPIEVYCLAAAISLMNSSLLHVICHSTQTDFMLRDCSSCITFECLSQSASIIRVSGFGVQHQVQKFLYDIFGEHGGMHLEIKFMLAHISSMLIFSFKKKLDFLWKCCISMMMTLTNVLFLEERKLGFSKIFNLFQSHPRMDDKDLTYKSTSVMIAANMEKIRMLYLKNEIKCGDTGENWTSTKEGREVGQQSGTISVDRTGERKTRGSQGNVCNGEKFIECNPGFHRNPSEWEDLVDFIECKSGKDYHSWLNNRSKFAIWKQKRTALLRQQKRRKSASGIVKETGAGKSVKVKSQERRSTMSGVESFESLVGQASSANHSDPSELIDSVVLVGCRPEEEQGKAGKKKMKDTTYLIVPGAGKSVEVKLQERRSRMSGAESFENLVGQASSTSHSNPLEFKDSVTFVGCRPEEQEQGKAGKRKRKETTYAVVPDTGKSVKVKLRELGSRMSGTESFENLVGQESSTNHTDPSELKDSVSFVGCRPEERGRAGKRKMKETTYAIVPDTGKSVNVKSQERRSRRSCVESVKNLVGQPSSSTNHADLSELKDSVALVGCRPEEEQGKAGKRKMKETILPGSGKSVEVKSQERRSGMPCVESSENLVGQESSTNDADPSERKDSVASVERRPEEGQGKAGKRKRKETTYVIVSKYNLRPRQRARLPAQL